jgi:hypothetical protein
MNGTTLKTYFLGKMKIYFWVGGQVKYAEDSRMGGK